MTRLRVFPFMLVLAALALIFSAGCDRRSITAHAGKHEPASNSHSVTVELVVNNSDRSFPKGMDANNNPYVAFVEKHTGVDLHLIVPQTGSYQESLNWIMSSGNVPDLINTGDPSWISKYVEMDMLMPLDDLLKTHGQELLRIFPEEAWEAVKFRGQIYAIPSLAEVPGNEVMYARKDWLDALGLDIPVTLEEYYQVMYAFTYHDPDGNGKSDTWGLTIMPEGLSRTAPFFGAFGVPRGGNQMMQWKEKDGELVYSGILPETKQALDFLAKLYGDGLLDREFILNKKGSFDEKIINGQVGMFSAAWYDTKGPILENMKKNPQAEWIRLPYPAGPGGQSGTAGADIVQSYSVIPKQSKHAREVLKVLTFIAGEGYRELKLGFEGEVWTEQDGVIVTDFAKHQEHIYRGTLHAIADPNDPEIRKIRLDSLGKQYQLNENVEYILQHVLRSDYQGPPTPSMGKYGAQLLKLEEETFTKIIMGLSPGQDFERFVNEWIAEGGWEIMHEVNQWYRDHQEEGQ
mgnify:CR=1 FL=1